MSRHVLTPKRAYADHQIVVGWDPPLGSYYAQVINLKAGEPDKRNRFAVITEILRRVTTLLHLPTGWLPAEPVFILLGADRIPIKHPDDVIQAVTPYARIPDGLHLALTLDELNEGNRRFRP
jgi:hypothetical protein